MRLPVSHARTTHLADLVEQALEVGFGVPRLHFKHDLRSVRARENGDAYRGWNHEFSDACRYVLWKTAIYSVSRHRSMDTVRGDPIPARAHESCVAYKKLSETFV